MINCMSIENISLIYLYAKKKTKKHELLAIKLTNFLTINNVGMEINLDRGLWSVSLLFEPLDYC